MAAYVDYTFYSEQFGGSLIPSAEFLPFAVKAGAFIDYVTFDRVASLMSLTSPSPKEAALIFRIKMAVCSVAEQQKKLSESGGGLISSESVGSHSVSYTSASTDRKVREADMTYAASMYLAHTGLMYRGINEDE